MNSLKACSRFISTAQPGPGVGPRRAPRRQRGGHRQDLCHARRGGCGARGRRQRAETPTPSAVIFGPAAAELQNPDRVQATNELSAFTAALNAAPIGSCMSRTPNACSKWATNSWPFPVPIVKRDGQWFFDTEAGKDEFLNRRIGKNELATLQSVRAYVEAQREYASQGSRWRRGAGVRAEVQQHARARKTGFTGRPISTVRSARSARSWPRRRTRVTAWKPREAGRRAGAVPRLFLQDPHPPGQIRARRQIRLRHQRQHDRRLRARGLARRIRRDPAS